MDTHLPLPCSSARPGTALRPVHPLTPAHPEASALAPGRVLSLHRCAGRQLILLHGRLWLTEPGDPHDHFLRPGQTRVLMSNGPVVIENDGDAVVLYRLR